ncbi:MAG: hypothetical protein HY842_07860, partial [Bacteroidetes bacterium]|nr:hypothetical protein [Bacteroidota bacterium]
MTTSRLFLLLLCSFFSFSVSAQLDFKLQLMPNGTRWGVYAIPDSTISPSSNTITGSGQVTIVAPLGFEIEGFQNGSGLWTNNAVINAPVENPSRSYISFGLVSDMPGIDYSATQPTLLFTFKKTGDCPDSLHLIENGVDPFDQLPNSANSNPGNEITVIDFGVFPIGQYTYHDNIALYAWDCHDCDGDGIPNAHEDTNGDGEWTPGVDVSDLCDGGGGCEAITAAQLRCASGGTGCGDNPSGPVSLAIDITGGTPPFTVKYSNGSTILTLQNYQSGTSFAVPASNGAVYSLVEITESEGCAGNPDDFTGEVEILLPGAAQFTTQPANVTVCAAQSASFEVCASATNGSFDIRWEFSTNQGATWQLLNLTGVFSQSDLGNGCKTLFVDNVTGLHGYRFRAVAEGTNVATATSQAATLTVQGPIQVGSQPVNVKVCGGEPAVFTADFINNGGGDIEYTWQLSHNNGASWWDAMPGPDLTGINSTVLTLENVPGNFNGDIFRLRARVGDCGFVYTQTALLTVEGPLEVTAHPANVKVCAGEPAVFTAGFGNFGAGSTDYKWQTSHDNGASWQDVAQSANVTGVNSTTLTLLDATLQHNDRFRLRGKVGTCGAVFSLTALLTVDGPVEITAQPQSTTICRGSEACFEVAATVANDGQPSYQWQVKMPGSTDWADIA